MCLLPACWQATLAAAAWNTTTILLNGKLHSLKVFLNEGVKKVRPQKRQKFTTSRIYTHTQVVILHEKFDEKLT